MKKLLVILLVVFFTTNLLALSPNDAVTFVSSTNNYLLSNETPAILSPQVQIKYNDELYWVIVGANGDNIGVYIPVSDKSEIASGAIEIRELITTNIVLSKMFQLRNSYPASDWPFSHPVKNRFFDIENSLRNLSPSISNVIIDLEKIEDTADLIVTAKKVKKGVDDLGVESIELANLVEEGIAFEKEFFSNPLTKETKNYEDLFKSYFSKVLDYKENYNLLKSDIDVLRQGIGSFQGNMSNTQKEFYLSVLRLPNETTALSSFFTLNDSTKTLVEEVFNTSKNIENFVLNLETRKNRNNAWQMLYGFDNSINKINSSFSSLNDAAAAILAEDNVNLWADQDSVAILKINYKQTVDNYNKGIYDKSINFASDAKKNVKSVLEKGVSEFVDNSGEIIFQVIILLIIVLVGIFLAEKFYFNKKKEGEINEYYGDEYYEN